MGEELPVDLPRHCYLLVGLLVGLVKVAIILVCAAVCFLSGTPALFRGLSLRSETWLFDHFLRYHG